MMRRPDNAFAARNSAWVEQSVHARFAEQAHATPDAAAVSANGVQFTFQQVETAANRVAQAILAARGGGNEPIALLLDSGASLVVAILAVLKSGKFYLPLDPLNPDARQRQVLRDAGASVILTHGENLPIAERLLAGAGPVIDIDHLPAGASKDHAAPSVGPNALAVLLYTSGSTGRPKGVMYTHRTALHCALRFINGQHICADDRAALLTSANYSLSVGIMFGALLNGAALCLYDLKARGVGPLARWLRDEAISIYYSVPSIFRQLIGTLSEEQRFPALRLIRLGGDTVCSKDVALYQRHFRSPCLLHVGLGTTETGAIRECFFDQTTRLDDAVVPVGYAVDDIDILVLDASRTVVGPGAPGEIGVRSAYLSPGYWGSHDLTDAVFVPDPDGSTRRVYLTGDTGRLLPDGCLIHLGRKDTQLKIRGHRVEPQEVERAVLGLPQVRDAAVVADQGPGGHRRLVAHVVPASPGTLQANDLRRSLRATLPDFMVPSVFVVRDDLPQLSGGKVDRVRLSAERHELEPEAPRNDIEARLAGIWERILRVTPIGRSDDFFALGGDSLAAEQLGVELGIAFGMDLPSSVLLEAPTIAGLAEVLKRGRQPAAIVALRTDGSRTPFFCIHGIGGDILPLQALVRHLGDDQPIYGLRADDGNVNRLSIEAIAAHYAKAIEHIQPDGPYALGGFSFGGTVAFELARQFVARGKTVGLLVLLDTYGPDYRLLPVLKRLGVHVKTFATAARGRRLPYLQARTLRLRKMARVRLSYLVEDIRAALRRWGAGRKPDTLRAAHWLALRNYVPGPYSGTIHLFRARDEVDVWYPDPVLGWGRLAAGGIEVHLVPGEHLTFMKEPHTSAWAGALRELLETVNREARDDEAVSLSAPMPPPPPSALSPDTAAPRDVAVDYLLSSPSPATTLRRPIEGGGA